MERFEGKAFIITGAGHGIGRAVAAALVRDGAFAAIVDLAAIEETTFQLGTHAVPLVLDPADPSTTGTIVEKTLIAFGRIDGLVMGDMKLDSAAALGHACAPHLARSGGSIVMVGPPATEEAMRSLATALGPLGVRVNAVCPGRMTPLNDPTEPPRDIPLRRYGHEEEVAQAILFLVSDSASYITGVNLAVDGGMGLLSESS